MFKNFKLMFITFSLLWTAIAYANPTLNALLHNQNDPTLGNKNGKITIVEFFDYQCSHCGNMLAPLNYVVRSNPNLRVVFKEYPILSSESELASRAALAAKMQGKYLKFNHALFTTRLDFNENNFLSIAKSLGLNVNKFKADMDSTAVKQQLRQNLILGQRLNIAGTPAFFIARTNATGLNQVKFVASEMSTYELQNAIRNMSR